VNFWDNSCLGCSTAILITQRNAGAGITFHNVPVLCFHGRKANTKTLAVPIFPYFRTVTDLGESVTKLFKRKKDEDD